VLATSSVPLSPGGKQCESLRPWRRAALYGLAVLCIAPLAQADTIRTRVGIGYTGQIVGIDAQGVLISHAGTVRTIPRDDIVRVDVDQYPDVAKVETLLDRGVSGAAEAERLYAGVLNADLPSWLRAFIEWRLFRLRLAVSRYPEALDAYLLLMQENPQFAAGVTWPPVSENDPDRQRAMLAKIDEALRKGPPEPIAGQLTKLRNVLSPAPRTPLLPAAPSSPKPLPQVPPPSSDAAEKAKIAFASLFGDRLVKVQATADPQDDVALAADLLQAAKIAGSQPEFLTLVCEKAWELGNKDPAGYATAAEAMKILGEKIPAMAEACQQNMFVTMQHQYQHVSGPARAEAGNSLLEALVRMAEQQERLGNPDQALVYLRQAQDVATSIGSPRKSGIQASSERLAHRQQTLVRIAERIRQSQAAPQDQKVQEDIFFLYAVELDNPADAAKYADALGNEGMKRCAQQAASPAEKLSEAACLELGDWYRFLADKASPAARPNMLAKACGYYKVYLERHTADDLSRTKALVAFQQVVSALEKARRGGADAGAPGFFGLPLGGASKVVFIVDRSGSMTDSIDFVKYELKRCIGVLSQEQQFYVIFYSSGPPVELPNRTLVHATVHNRQLAFEFIDGVIAQGETDPSKALERAFALGPDAICLLTDGEFDRAIIGLIKRLNVASTVRVHTIGFLYKTGEAVLKQIAQENNGAYKFVSEADLADIARPSRR